jgi:hypothetical protein
MLSGAIVHDVDGERFGAQIRYEYDDDPLGSSLASDEHIGVVIELDDLGRIRKVTNHVDGVHIDSVFLESCDMMQERECELEHKEHKQEQAEPPCDSALCHSVHASLIENRNKQTEHPLPSSSPVQLCSISEHCKPIVHVCASNLQSNWRRDERVALPNAALRRRRLSRSTDDLLDEYALRSESVRSLLKSAAELFDGADDFVLPPHSVVVASSSFGDLGASSIAADEAPLADEISRALSRGAGGGGGLTLSSFGGDGLRTPSPQSLSDLRTSPYRSSEPPASSSLVVRQHNATLYSPKPLHSSKRLFDS